MQTRDGSTDIDQKSGGHPLTVKAWLALLAMLCGLALPAPLTAANFLFTWRASTDPSVTAYGIFQRKGDAEYIKVGELKIRDLDNPSTPSYLFTGLTDGNTYWFAVTLIYASGDESGLSGKTCVKVNGQIEDCTEDDDDNSGGTTVYVNCFIRTAGDLFFRKHRTSEAN